MEEIASKSKIVIYRREGIFTKYNIRKFNCKLMTNKTFDFASSDFKKGHFNNLDLKVNQYIGNNLLYTNEIAKNVLSGNRYLHSVNAAKFALKLAKSHKMDMNKAYVTGLLHDIAKE
jgi:nicotinate-nucleotide adenylyltransferase